MNNTDHVTNLIENPNATILKREFVLMGESEIGERINGNKYFETGHGTFPSIKEAELTGFQKIKTIRWLVGEKIYREGMNPTYNFVSKPTTSFK